MTHIISLQHTMLSMYHVMMLSMMILSNISHVRWVRYYDIHLMHSIFILLCSEPSWIAKYCCCMLSKYFAWDQIHYRLAQLWIHNNGPHSWTETSYSPGGKMVSCSLGHRKQRFILYQENCQ